MAQMILFNWRAEPESVKLSKRQEPTADLPTQRMQVHEKTARMLRSLLEA
jgi:DNA-binding ferritin-like protein